MLTTLLIQTNQLPFKSGGSSKWVWYKHWPISSWVYTFFAIKFSVVNVIYWLIDDIILKFRKFGTFQTFLICGRPSISRLFQNLHFQNFWNSSKEIFGQLSSNHHCQRGAQRCIDTALLTTYPGPGQIQHSTRRTTRLSTIFSRFLFEIAHPTLSVCVQAEICVWFLTIVRLRLKFQSRSEAWNGRFRPRTELF